MDILLTFAGNRDPYNPEVVKGLVADGPVLTLLAERSFATVHIFTTPNTLLNAQQLRQEIAVRAAGIAAHESTTSTSPIPPITRPSFCA